MNTREGHTVGHQGKDGKLFGDGDYQSSFNAVSYRPTWRGRIRQELLNIEQSMKQKVPVGLRQKEIGETQKAAELHLLMVRDFYHRMGGAVCFNSHTTCLACLGDMPEHPLPCGHVICSSCIRTFGRTRSKTTFHLHECPLHSGNHWRGDIQISLKPHLAGVRVLCLDG